MKKEQTVKVSADVHETIKRIAAETGLSMRESSELLFRHGMEVAGEFGRVAQSPVGAAVRARLNGLKDSMGELEREKHATVRAQVTTHPGLNANEEVADITFDTGEALDESAGAVGVLREGTEFECGNCEAVLESALDKCPECDTPLNWEGEDGGDKSTSTMELVLAGVGLLGLLATYRRNGVHW